MGGRKHPLEVYQRARPFAADEEPRPRKKPPRRRHGPGLGRALKGFSSRWAQRIGRIPLRRAGLVGAVLVLILAGVYAVKFWPSAENGDPGGSLRSEWRDPVDREQREARSTYWIQVASDKIPGLGFQGHEEREAAWKREEASVQRQLDARLERDLPGIRLRVKAIYSDQETQDDVRLLVGSRTWTDRKDPQIRQILRWLQQNPAFEDAYLLPDAIAIPLEPN